MKDITILEYQIYVTLVSSGFDHLLSGLHLNQKTFHFSTEKKFYFEFTTSSSSFCVLEIC